MGKINMTQEEKDLLIKDLCSRLPYGVIIEHEGNLSRLDTIFMCDSISISSTSIDKELCYNLDLDEVKPYLFPLSSITDELWDKEFMGYNITEFTRDSFKYGCETLEFYDYNPDLLSMVGFINQLIKNHFDIYGLIPKGLAIDATGLNLYELNLL